MTYRVLTMGDFFCMGFLLWPFLIEFRCDRLQLKKQPVAFLTASGRVVEATGRFWGHFVS